jgi:hypothetical protein
VTEKFPRVPVSGIVDPGYGLRSIEQDIKFASQQIDHRSVFFDLYDTKLASNAGGQDV